MDTGNPHAGTVTARQMPTAGHAPYRYKTWDQRPGNARQLHITDLTLDELFTLMRLGLRPALLQS